MHLVDLLCQSAAYGTLGTGCLGLPVVSTKYSIQVDVLHPSAEGCQAANCHTPAVPVTLSNLFCCRLPGTRVMMHVFIAHMLRPSCNFDVCCALQVHCISYHWERSF